MKCQSAKLIRTVALSEVLALPQRKTTRAAVHRLLLSKVTQPLPEVYTDLGLCA